MIRPSPAFEVVCGQTTAVNHQPHEKPEPRRSLGLPNCRSTAKINVSRKEEPVGRAGGEFAPLLEAPDDSVLLPRGQRCGGDHIPKPEILRQGRRGEATSDVTDPAVVRQGLPDCDAGQTGKGCESWGSFRYGESAWQPTIMPEECPITPTQDDLGAGPEESHSLGVLLVWDKGPRPRRVRPSQPWPAASKRDAEQVQIQNPQPPLSVGIQTRDHGRRQCPPLISSSPFQSAYFHNRLIFTIGYMPQKPDPKLESAPPVP